jgi:hypothetical protein
MHDAYAMWCAVKTSLAFGPAFAPAQEMGNTSQASSGDFLLLPAFGTID